MANRITRMLKQFFPQYNYDFLPPHLALMNSPSSPFARLTALTLSISIVIAIVGHTGVVRCASHINRTTYRIGALTSYSSL
ncbi:MAG: hypothetical protein AB8W37_05410 [Arsenophonus endosymbiont of Dermacentor nuttalli]